MIGGHKMIDLVIVTGAYGAGKSLTAQAFEEAGYYVTDRIPLGVVDTYFKELIKETEKYSKVVLTVEANIALETYKIAKKYGEFRVKFFGITCDVATLIERYRLSRKVHPDQPKGKTLEQAIKDDVSAIRQIRDHFDVYIDTGKMTKDELRNRIYDACIGAKEKFIVSFSSFGYKVNVPQDIETVFDVRLLPNPYWVPALKEKTGLDKPVKDYVLNAPETKEYLKHVIAYLDFYLEELKKKDRGHASIGIACSGGQHRSVVIAEYLKEHYSKKYFTNVTHKNIPNKKTDDKNN